MPVRKLGSTGVVTSCPASEKKLAAPIPPTRGVSHRSPDLPEPHVAHAETPATNELWTVKQSPADYDRNGYVDDVTG